jgi:hypothetical protein
MAATYTPIASITLGAAAASVTFNSIPQTYTDLVIVSQAKLTTNTRAVIMRFNNDTGSNYSLTRVYGDGATAYSDRFTGQDGIDVAFISPSNWNISRHNIQNYSNSTTYKTTLGRWDDSAAYSVLMSGLWRSTSAITSMSLTVADTFVSGSTFDLYGILGANA